MRMSPPGDGAVGGDEFTRLMAPFAPFETAPVLGVAVSGGRDSLTLALLAQDWALKRQGRVVGLIVDHGLRAASAAEAERTQALLARHGLEGTILVWSGAKPPSGVQEAARHARYRLLREECRRRGILHLLLAHHADDQAETVAMRKARCSGRDGLAGMAALIEQPEVRLLRPLLAMARARLTATLVARGVQWVDDPSNFDPRFERARLRLAGPVAVAAPERLDDGRSDRERSLARAAVEALEFEAPGLTAIDRTGFAILSHDQKARLLSRVVQAAGGRDHPPRRDRLERAAGRLVAPVARGKSGKGQDFTLSACLLSLRQMPGSRRLRWLVQAEHGRNKGQPLIPAAFFACGASSATHLD
jgi:tRNA(Ile)-lysidine synthase